MFKRLGFCLALGLHINSAIAGPIPLFPGTLIQAAPCTDDFKAKCWSSAQRLTRFAAERRATLDPVTIDVRLAWSNTDVLVRTKGLSPHQRIEISISTDSDDVLAKAQLVTVQNGINKHRLSPAPSPGQLRAIRVVLKDQRDGSSRIWAPALDGDLTRPAMLWVTDTIRTELTPEITDNDAGWTVKAPENSSITIRHHRPMLPVGGKGIGPPWQQTVSANVPFSRPPMTGWFDVKVKDSLGNHGHRLLHWHAPTGAKLRKFGIHPEPKALKKQDGKPFILSGPTTICAESKNQAVAAVWLSREITRLTGQDTHLSCESPDIQLLAPEVPIEGDESFRIKSREDGITIEANAIRGHLYGAMTTADLIGFDGTAEAVDIEDWPRIDRRILFHEVHPNNGPMSSPEQMKRFIERIVLRGRFNMLILELKGGLQYVSHPALSRKDAWTGEQMKSVLETARQYGIEVIPALNTPAHSMWIGKTFPHLQEDETASLLCTQNPDTRSIISDLYRELWSLYDHPRFIHIGHDEINWRTHRKHETQRCVRCQGTPRWQLLTEDLLWHHEFLAELGVKPILWSDMLVKGWHGKQGGMFRAANRIEPKLRPEFTVMSWGRVGDSVGELVPKGYTVIRGNTGYADWKREGLHDIADGIAGAALALFNPIPWSSFEGTAGNTRLYHHWTNVILAGATAWEPEIDTIPIDTALLQLEDLPPYLPGYRAWQQPVRLSRFGIRAELETDHELKIPDFFEVGSMRYFSGILFEVNPGETESFLLRKNVHGLSIVQAVNYGPNSQTVLAKAHHRSAHQTGVEVGRLLVTYQDQKTVSVPFVLGMNTHRSDAPVRGSLLFEGSGTIRLSKQTTAAYNPRVPDGTLYRTDWINPRPNVKLKNIVFKASHPEVTWVIAGIGTALIPSTNSEDD